MAVVDVEIVEGLVDSDMMAVGMEELDEDALSVVEVVVPGIIVSILIKFTLATN